MSRYSRPAKSQPEPTKYSEHQISTIGAVSRLLSHFISGHQNKSIQYSWRKMHSYFKKKQRSSQFLANKLNNFCNRKYGTYLRWAYNHLLSQKLHSQTQQVSGIKKNKTKMVETGLNLVHIIDHKLTHRKTKEYFHLLASRSKQLKKAMDFKIMHLNRIFNSTRTRKLRNTFEKIKIHKQKMKQKLVKLARLEAFFNRKNKFNLQSSFRTLLVWKLVDKSGKKTGAKGPATRRQQPPKAPVTQQVDEEPDRRQIEQKNRKLQGELKRIKNDNEAIIQEYKLEIEKLEKEQEGLRFNSDLLDQSNRDLEMEIIQRQKQGRKRMSNREMWQYIYQNFLFMISNFKNTTLPKEKVLEYLETPLTPLSINIDVLKEENAIMSELLEEYRKFYGKKNEESQSENILPYDVLSAKNKFFYLIAESLLSQGIGSAAEIDQLKADLDNLIQKNS